VIIGADSTAVESSQAAATKQKRRKGITKYRPGTGALGRRHDWDLKLDLRAMAHHRTSHHPEHPTTTPLLDFQELRWADRVAGFRKT
jgi:hypothetical protein